MEGEAGACGMGDEEGSPGRVVVPDTGERDYDTEGEGSAFDGRRASQEGGKAQEPP